MERIWYTSENEGEYRVVVRESSRPIVENVIAAYADYDSAAEAVEALEARQRLHRCLAAGTHPGRDIMKNCWRCR